MNSVIGQTVAPREVLLIDDGSTDGSAALCDSLANTHPIVKAIHIAHGGAARARNTGLRLATGEWVASVDSDDVISPHFIDITTRIAIEHNADIVECEWVESDEHDHNSLSAIAPVDCEVKVFTANQAIADSFYQKTLRSSMCRRLFKREIIADYEFTEGEMYEDLAAEYDLLSRAHRLVYTPTPLYHYIHRGGSQMTMFAPCREAVIGILQRTESKALPEHVPAVRSRLLSACFNMLRVVPQSYENRDEILNRCWAEIKRLRCSCLLDSNVRLRNKVAIILSLLGKRITRITLSKF